jgi:predicted methyltransferase
VSEKWKLPWSHHIGKVKQDSIKNGQRIPETEGDNEYFAVKCGDCGAIRLAANLDEKMAMEAAGCDCRFTRKKIGG